MAYKVEVAPLANKDLEEILDYILRELSNPSDAADLLDGIGSCYSNLEKMPEMYERCRDTRLKAIGYRRITVKNYVIIYKVEGSIKTVYIMRCFYGGRDYEKTNLNKF